MALLPEEKLTLTSFFTAFFALLPSLPPLPLPPILHILSGVATTWGTVFIHELLY